MSLLSFITEKRSLENPRQWLIDFFGGGSESDAGVRVTPSSAMQSTAVLACVRVISESVASLPCLIYERLPEGGKKRAVDHPLYALLHDAPNPYQSAFEFAEMLQGHACLRGNAYAEIIETKGGTVEALVPLHPDKVQTVSYDDGKWAYRLPGTKGGQRTLLRHEMFHLRGLSDDGRVGLSPIALARNAIGLTIATERFGSRFFANDARPGGVLQMPGKLTKEAKGNLKASWQEGHSGDNQHKVAVLEEGLTWQAIGINPDEAQFLETRKFQTNEIARIFRVPPHLIGDLERSTFSNIEHQSLEFVVHTLRPWLVRWEQAFARALLTAEERRKFTIEILVDALLRGDQKTRFEAYNLARNAGWMNADEIRERENMNPLPDGQGQIYLIPLNMMPASQAGTSANDGSAERSRIAARYRILVDDAFSRLVQKEVKAARRAAGRLEETGDLAEFRIWVDGFYADLATHATRLLAPAVLSLVESLAVTVESPADGVMQRLAADLALELGETHVFASRDALLDAPTAEAVRAMLDAWEASRTAESGAEAVRQAERAVMDTHRRHAGLTH